MNQSPLRTFPLVPFVALIVGTILLDQLTKIKVLDLFDHKQLPWTISPLFDIILVWNRGVSWGMFNNSGAYNAYIFSGLSALISIFLGVWLRRAPNKLIATSLSLIIGGAIGNLIDRLRFGGVVDFLHFHWQNYSFPAFNIADSTITLGVMLMAWEEIKNFKREKNQ